jgi:BirA family biotin operon repressor/biotin-[acetyl-CoA-carboxylase] ligase
MGNQTMPLKWPAKAISEALQPLLTGLRVQVLAEVDSTNSELMRRARAGASDPLLLVAECQSAGRGRLGRVWHSSAGAALTFSLGLMLGPRDWAGLSLAVGVSLAESLQAAGGPMTGLKWPNDLWLDGRKLAGVLIETAVSGRAPQDPRYCVIGVGINIAPLSAHGLSTAPAWLQECRPGVDAAQVLQELAVPLLQSLQLFEAQGFAPFQARFAARDVLRDRAVQLSDGTQGRACGVDSGGALLVHTAAGMKVITSSEVSVRPC